MDGIEVKADALEESFAAYETSAADIAALNAELAMLRKKIADGAIAAKRPLLDGVKSSEPSAFVAEYLRKGVESGLEVMLDADSGMIFFVKTVSAGFACTAELQNGYGYSPSGAVRIDKAFDPAGRYFFIAGGGVFTPNYPLFADLSSTSAMLTNCQRADGYGGFVNAGATSVVQAGDFPVTDEYTLQPFVIGHGVVAVGAGTISMASPPVVTAAKTRLALWVRGS